MTTILLTFSSEWELLASYDLSASTGFLAAVCPNRSSLYKAKSRIDFIKQTPYWLMGQQATAILCVCLPLYKPLFCSTRYSKINANYPRATEPDTKSPTLSRAVSPPRVKDWRSMFSTKRSTSRSGQRAAYVTPGFEMDGQEQRPHAM